MSLLLYLSLLGDNNKRPESSNPRLCPGVLTALLGADEHSRALFRRSLIMGDGLDYLRAVESEQGLSLQGLRQEAADAEERHMSSHAELLEMMTTLLKTSRESEAQQKFGGAQRLPTADTTGRDAVSPSLDLSDDGTGSRKEERGGAAGADLTGGQLGGREQDWRVGPQVSSLPLLRGVFVVAYSWANSRWQFLS